MQSIQSGDLVWVKADWANIRENSTTVNSRVIDVAGRGARLVIISQNEKGDWFWIRSPDQKYGWISRKCIMKDYIDTLR